MVYIERPAFDTPLFGKEEIWIKSVNIMSYEHEYLSEVYGNK